MQLRTERVDALAQLGDSARRIDDAELGGDAPQAGHVAVAPGRVQPSRAVALVRGEEAVRLGDVHPLEQVRVVGVVRAAIGGDAGHPRVDGAHRRACGLGLLRGAVRRGRQEAGRALEPAPGVLAEVRVVGDAGHRQRVHRLQEQGAEATDEERDVGVHDPHRVTSPIPALAVGAEQLAGVIRRAVAGHPRPDGVRQRRPQRFHTAIVAHGEGRCRGRRATARLRGWRTARIYTPAMMTSDDGPPAGGASSRRRPTPAATPVTTTTSTRTGMRWVPRGIALFWLGLVVLVVLRWLLGKTRGLLVLLLISLFLAFAVEPGVNRLARRGWRRGRATGLVLLLVFLAVVVLLGTVGTLVGRQVADLLTNGEDYVNQVVDFLNDNFGQDIDPQTVIDEIYEEDGAVRRFIASQSDEALSLSVQALGFVLQVFSVILFTYYLVADGPRLRRSICSRLPPERQRRVLEAWNLAIEKTGGYLYSRGILAILSAIFHSIVFWIIDLPASIALGIWVGVVSQFLPVIGTYLAGLLPVLVALIEDPRDVIVVLIAVVVYWQIENYLFLPASPPARSTCIPRSRSERRCSARRSSAPGRSSPCRRRRPCRRSPRSTGRTTRSSTTS